MTKEIITKPIFFSYSWKDQAIAMRIYYDLVRSSLGIWRDRNNAEKENFHLLKNIYTKIDLANHFLLLDSSSSRTSFFVQKEISYFIEQQRNNPNKKLIICLVEDKLKTQVEKELFEGQNLLLYFDFSNIELYDTHKKYKNSINDLIKHFGSSFTPWTNLPDGKDFEDEVSVHKILDEDRKTLMSDFENFKHRHLNEYPNLDKRLLVLIDDCKKLNVDSITPFISLGVLYAELGQKEKNKTKLVKAKNIFLESIEKFPNDPRAWRGLGGAAYHLSDYQTSKNALEQAINKTLESGNKSYLKYLELIKENKAEALLKLEQYHEALIIFSHLLEDAIKKNCITPDHFIDVAFCYLKLNQLQKCEDTLLNGISVFPNNSNLLIEMGRYKVEVEAYNDAAYYYKRALKFRPLDLKLLASLCMLLYHNGSEDEFYYYANKLFMLQPNSTFDYYLLGNVYFFYNDIPRAIECFYNSKGEHGPYYDSI